MMNPNQDKYVRFEEWKSEQSSFSIDNENSQDNRPFYVRKPSLSSLMSSVRRRFERGSERISSWRKSIRVYPLIDKPTKDQYVKPKKKVHDPQGRFLQQWNKVFVLVCIIAVSLDPLFFYIPVIDNDKKCLDLDRTLKITACVLRSITDLFYIFHIILQFRTGYIAPPSRIFGRGELVEDSYDIAKRYLLSYFIVDVVAVLPLPQIVILVITPNANIKSLNSAPQNFPTLFTVEELALYNGSDPKLPIFLGIIGSVFDVSKGKSHYGVGGGYNHFAGRDASRAFVSGNFTGDGLTDSLRDLSSAEVKSIVDWRDFYFRTYTYVGKLVGRYYDSEGNPTKYLKGVEAKAARGAQLMEKQKNEEAKLPSCNSRWSQQEGSEVWCDDGYPRLVQRPTEIALTGKMSKRCACFKEEDLDQPGLEVYKGCDYSAKTCRL